MSCARFAAKRWISATVASFLTSSCLVGAALAESSVLYEFQMDRDYEGPIQRIAFDRAGNSWISTPRHLYQVVNGKPSLVNLGASRDTRLALAPAGDMYAWLVNGTPPFGLFTVELLKPPKQKLTELRLDVSPYGFDTFYIGARGDLIVTSTPLDNAEGLRGDFLYVFWSRTGKELARVRLSGPRIGVVDVGGSALLLMGEKDAMALGSDGTELWRLSGGFRKGALAGKGTIALLNPARAINEVHVIRRGRPTVVQMSSPVHDLALTPDGSNGAVAIDAGRLFFLAPPSCEANSCRVTAMSSLPVAGTYYISAVRFLDKKTVALGVFQATGTAPDVTYETGAALAVTTSGQVKFHKPIKLARSATWSPLIDVTYGMPDFAAYTPETALFVRVDR